MTTNLQTNNGSQTLLIDLDDTMVENNIYFERAIADFISFLNHQEFTPQQVRATLNEVERECIIKHGYGLHSFAHALVDTFERLSVEPITPELHETIWGFSHQIAEHPMEILEGVPETLQYLAERHHLIVMTKGRVTEQMGKIERSGLMEYFTAVEVVAEKDVETYRGIVDKYALPRELTWMVGNSPKSDINPALNVGLHAVFVPHDQTWVLEHEELASPSLPGQKLLQLKRFAEMREHF